MHRSGFVSIIGNPNVGKSTLLNKLVGQSLSIITHKAQTTRHRIKGILSADDYQVIFSDTPGILKPAYKLHEKMMDAVDQSFSDADVMVLLIEAGQKEFDDAVIKKIKSLKIPLIVVINKIDKIEEFELEKMTASWQEKIKPDELIPVSATENFNLDMLLKLILKYLPEAPPYFSKEELTDRSERFFTSEIIREKILLNYQKEIPYSTEVVIDSFKDEEKIIKIYAIIYVMRESQKAILLGHKGASIKKTLTQARLHLEKFLGKKVFLETTIKVSDKWRDDDRQLRRFGYEE